MSTQPMPMVQVFAPDGTLGDIPYDKLHDALGAGAKIAAKVKAPDGTVGFVPGDRVPEAMKAGATRVPLDMHDADGGKPGFWSQAYDKAASMIPSKEAAIRALGGSGVTAYELATNPSKAIGQALQQTPGLPQAQEFLRSRDAGESIPRSALNAAGTMVGVNPEAQERAAAQGNTAGVLADAAVPAAAAVAGPAIGEGVNALRGPALDALSQYKSGIQSTAEALQHPSAIPGKVVSKLADLIPDTPEAAAAKQRVIEEAQAAEINKARAMQDVQIRREATAKAAADRAAAKAAITKPLNPIYGPAAPTPEQLAQGVKLSDLVGEKPSGITVVPEPRAPFAGETPNYMASVPRAQLQDLALAGKPGAGTQLQQLGQPVLYAPSGAGISNLKSSIALRDLLGQAPGDFTRNQTLNPIGATGARVIQPGNEFESLFGPEHKEVGDLAEWETGNREGVRIGSDLDQAAKSIFGGKSFDALTPEQKAHILRIAQTQTVGVGE